MSAAAVTGYLTALCVCYFVGLKIGVAVSALKKLGTSA